MKFAVVFNSRFGNSVGNGIVNDFCTYTLRQKLFHNFKLTASACMIDTSFNQHYSYSYNSLNDVKIPKKT